MKIKFVEAGYEKFTGHFGATYFENGVSVDDVSEGTVRLFASVTTVEIIGEGKVDSDNERYSGSMDIAAVSTNCMTLADAQRARAAGIGILTQVMQAPEAALAPTQKTLTQAELEAIADKGGIAALRALAEPLGVRGRGIAELIGEIMNKQKAGEPEVAPLAEGQPDVVTTEQAE